MKLVEILARELEIWPDDFNSNPTAAITQDGDRTINAFDGVDGSIPDKSQLTSSGDWSRSFWTGFGLRSDILADDFETAIVTRGQWKEARDALNKPAVEAWNGEGLPPVGIEVEALLPALGNARYWQAAKVVHGPLPDSPAEILVFSLENTKPSWVAKFRPIRTPEQIAAEDRRAAIECMAGELGGHWSEDAKAPHRDMAAYLYDSGWRKQQPKPE